MRLLGLEDGAAAGFGPPAAFRQPLGGFLDCPAAFLPVFLDLAAAGVEVPHPLLALGQFDLDVGGLRSCAERRSLQRANLLGQAAEDRFHFGRRGAERLAVFLRFGQPGQGRVLLLPGLAVLLLRAVRCWSHWLRRPSAAVRATRFSVSAFDGLLVLGRAALDQGLLGVDVRGQLARHAVGRLDRRRQLPEQHPQGAQLASLRDQADRGVPRPDDQRAIRRRAALRPA